MSNLDDFFKKRDKKKKTTKSKFPTLDTDEFAKKLEATSIVNSGGDVEDLDANENNENLISNNVNSSSFLPPASSSTANADHLDEDWKPFDSDENKDYSGLRINIQNWKSEDQDYLNEGGIDDNEKKTNCPWGAPSSQLAKKEDDNKPDQSESQSNKTESDQSVKTNKVEPVENNQTEVAAAPAAPAPKSSEPFIPPALRRQREAEAAAAAAAAAASASNADKTNSDSTAASSSTGGAYVPPHLRNKTSSEASRAAIPNTSVNYRRPNKSQPNINDTMEFPTLDAAGGDDKPSAGDKSTGNYGNDNERFEMPKKSGKIEPKSSGNMIDLENKFTALSSTNN